LSTALTKIWVLSLALDIRQDAQTLIVARRTSHRWVDA
jgi:hypothetical protein